MNKIVGVSMERFDGSEFDVMFRYPVYSREKAIDLAERLAYKRTGAICNAIGVIFG